MASIALRQTVSAPDGHSMFTAFNVVLNELVDCLISEEYVLQFGIDVLALADIFIEFPSRGCG
jgi:hypothetical protein